MIKSTENFFWDQGASFEGKEPLKIKKHLNNNFQTFYLHRPLKRFSGWLESLTNKFLCRRSHNMKTEKKISSSWEVKNVIVVFPLHGLLQLHRLFNFLLCRKTEIDEDWKRSTIQPAWAKIYCELWFNIEAGLYSFSIDL